MGSSIAKMSGDPRLSQERLAELIVYHENALDSFSTNYCNPQTVDEIHWFQIHFDAIEALRELLAARERDAWQPIESAPKDGSEIIVGSADGGVFAGFWSDTPNYWGDIGWFEESDRGVCDATRKPYSPTHWKQLPAPPQDSAIEGREES